MQKNWCSAKQTRCSSKIKPYFFTKIEKLVHQNCWQYLVFFVWKTHYLKLQQRQNTLSSGFLISVSTTICARISITTANAPRRMVYITSGGRETKKPRRFSHINHIMAHLWLCTSYTSAINTLKYKGPSDLYMVPNSCNSIWIPGNLNLSVFDC